MFTSVHTARAMWKATSGQRGSIIKECAATGFMLRTAYSAKTHGVMRTRARSAQPLFGRRTRPGESRAGMTRHWDNDAAPTSGMFPTEGQDAKETEIKVRPNAHLHREVGCQKGIWSVWKV